MNLTRENWSNGWIPNDDEIGGRVAGLIRMDNCTIDELGCVRMTTGGIIVNPTSLPYEITSVFSKTINGEKYRFISLSDATIQFVVGEGDFAQLAQGGSATRATFGSGLGHVFFFSGNLRQKYNVTEISNITPPTPSNNPAVMEAAKNDFAFVTNDFSSWYIVNDDGTNLVQSTYLEFDTKEVVGVVETAGTWNSMVMGAGATGDPGDKLFLYLRFSNPDLVTSVKLLFVTDTLDPMTDFYSFEWFNYGDGNTFNSGTDAWSVFSCWRADFKKEGAGEDKDWSTVTGIRIIVSTSNITTVRLLENGLFFSGGNLNPLNGNYEYMQVYVHSTGTYLAKGSKSASSPYVTLVNGRALITPVVDTKNIGDQYNEIWIYRRDATYMLDVQPIGEARKLDRWYRVKVLTVAGGYAPFEDGVSDSDAIIEGNVYNEMLAPIMLTDDEIKMMTEKLFNSRMIYITEKDVLFSAYEDPGLYSPLWTVRLSGSGTEKNLWIKIVSVNQCLIGTTEDIYEISGTLSELPNGFLDMRITPMGISSPPIHESAVVRDGTVVYVGTDGVRTPSSKLSNDLDLFWRGETRHGVPGILVRESNTGEYCLEIAQGKLWFGTELKDGSRRVFKYDFKNQKWELWTQNVIHMYREEDDILLLTYRGDDGGYVKYTDQRTWLDGQTGQPVDVITVSDSNGQSRNRKDVFTLKITANTYEGSVRVYLKKDFEAWYDFGEFVFYPMEEVLISLGEIPELELGFRYQLRIYGAELYGFKLETFTIEYEPRPEQLTFYRFQNTNLGSYAKKKISTIPLVIDTIENDCVFTPRFDSINLAPSTVNTVEKRTYIHYFLENTVGIDLGGTISGGPFELYEMMQPTIIETYPLHKKFDQVGPYVLDKVGKLLGFRIQLLTGNVDFPVRIYCEDTLIREETLTTVPNTNQVYEVTYLPKSLNGTVLRVEFGPTTEYFHRYYFELKVNLSGIDTDVQVIRL